MLNIRINSNATTMLAAVADKVDTYPNRIKQAQTTALISSSKVLPKRVGVVSRGAKHIEYDVVASGATGAVLVARPPKKVDSKGKHKYSKYFAAAVALGGRKRFVLKQSHLKKGNYFVLRPESRAQYGKRKKPPLTIPKSYSQKSKIEPIIREVVIHELQKAFKRQGFGPRGGRSGSDIGRVTAGR